jgi:hypothetical protein
METEPIPVRSGAGRRPPRHIMAIADKLPGQGDARGPPLPHRVISCPAEILSLSGNSGHRSARRVGGDLSAVARRAKAEAVKPPLQITTGHDLYGDARPIVSGDGGLRRSLSSGRALRGPGGLQPAYGLADTNADFRTQGGQSASATSFSNKKAPDDAGALNWLERVISNSRREGRPS